MATRPQVELLEKNKPRQERAKRTYEAILNAASELLVEVGVERISTNLIAERAGITVPALYRYFPNKYAVLNALGVALMDRQTAVFNEWFEKYLKEENYTGLIDNTYDLLRATHDITKEQTGGLEIMQALRTVAPLQDVRLSAHRLIAEQFRDVIASEMGRSVDPQIEATARLTIETAYALILMVLEDDTLSVEHMLKAGAQMMKAYWLSFLQTQLNIELPQ